ncbi:MAG: DUF5678 domain-containing protein, partial [Acidimicrobiales bacterium]
MRRRPNTLVSGLRSRKMAPVAMPNPHEPPSSPTNTWRTRRVRPVPRPHELEGFEGKWVAVDGRRVVASAETSHELALKLQSMDPDRLGEIVMQFVRPMT